MVPSPNVSDSRAGTDKPDGIVGDAGQVATLANGSHHEGSLADRCSEESLEAHCVDPKAVGAKQVGATLLGRAGHVCMQLEGIFECSFEGIYRLV